MSEAKGNEILWCQLCKGSGRFKEGICPACGGVGKFLAPDKWVWCSLCKGSGGIEQEVVREQTARGTSWVIEKIPCPACRGAGRVRPREL